MAATGVGITLGGDLGEGRFNTSAKPSQADPIASVAAVVSAATAVTADVATLVADGASPTQAHVTTLNGHYTTLLAAITAASGAVGSANLSVSVDLSSITTRNKLRAAMAAALKFLESSDIPSG